MSAYTVLNRAALTSGLPEDVSQVVANFDAIAAVINGNLDQTNIAATATPAVTSISLSSNTKTAIVLSGAGAGLTIGGDTNLYRSAAGVLQTDGSLNLGTGAAGGKIFINAPATSTVAFATLATSNGPNNYFQIQAGGTIQWGPGGVSAQDVFLARGANAGTLKISSPSATTSTYLQLDSNGNGIAEFQVNGANGDLLYNVNGIAANVFGVTRTGAVANTLILASGKLLIGNTDTNLYRAAAGQLKTDGIFIGDILFSAVPVTTARTGGAAAALPANPVEYIPVLDSNGNRRYIPAYS